MLRLALFAILVAACGSDGGGDDGGDDAPPPPPAPDGVGVFVTGDGDVFLNLDLAATERRFYLGASQPAFSTAYPVAGDFDGDGLDSVGFFASRAGRVHLASSANVEGGVDLVFYFGGAITALRRATAGDFDGDGVDTIAIFEPATATATIAATNTDDPQVTTHVLGDPDPDAYPFAGDFDGDGIDELALYRAATTTFEIWDLAGATITTAFVFGPAASLPLAGDWNGDGVDGVGAYEPATGTFHLRNTLDAGAADATVAIVHEHIPGGTGNEPGAVPALPLAGRWNTAGDTPRSTGFAWTIGAPADHGFVTDALDAAVAAAGDLEHLRSLLVVRDGVLVAEHYFHGYDGTMVQNVKSVSKSVLSALVGIAIERGELAGIETPVGTLLPGSIPNGDPREAIVLRHLLTMTAGLTWSEVPFPAGFHASPDWVEFVLEQDYAGVGPFVYSTGLTHTGSAIVTRAVGGPIGDYADTHLFGPLGIDVVRWDYEPNPDAPQFGGAEVFLRPRDMARFGELYLETANGRGPLFELGLVTQAWVRASIADPDNARYGYWWWIDTFVDTRDRPFDSFHAAGFGGQHIFCFPDDDLIVVMTSRISGTPGAHAAANRTWLRQLLASVIRRPRPS